MKIVFIDHHLAILMGGVKKIDVLSFVRLETVLYRFFRNNLYFFTLKY